jgi:CopG antitoxin of type II toxin-antitoxin system
MRKKPRRHSEAQIARYWLTHDSAEEIDWAAPGVRLEFDPDVERPTQPVTVRLPRPLLQALKVLAKDRDVPYQSLMKVFLAEKVIELRRRTRS